MLKGVPAHPCMRITERIFSNLRNCTVESVFLSDCLAPDLAYELYVDLLQSCKTKKPLVEISLELTTARAKEFVCRGLLKLASVQSAKRISIAVVSFA